MIVQADARQIPLADESVHMCVTSPPYWGLRDYGLGDAGIGLEKTPDEYVANIVAVFREVWRVLRDDGTLWLNLGDSFAGGGRTSYDTDAKSNGRGGNFRPGAGRADGIVDERGQRNRNGIGPVMGLKPKDLVGIPWRVAFALQADGWYLRSDIIWHKTNPMPESVTDRPTKSHEYLFLLAKQPRYYYDAEAIREEETESTKSRNKYNRAVPRSAELHHGKGYLATPAGKIQDGRGRNRRDVWTIPTSPYKGAHFATFPPKLVEPCVLAGSPLGGIVLDPFCGSGTVGQVCRLHGRRFVGLDLSMKYLRELALPRAEGKQAAGANLDLPLFQNSG